MMHTFEYCLKHIGDTGTVRDVREALVSVTGLAGGVVGEGVSFENGCHGMIMSLGASVSEILVFSRESIAVGTRVSRTGKPLSVSVGDAILGRTVNAMGYLLSGEYDKSAETESRPIDPAPPGISERAKITKPFETGVAIVDLVVPIGRGQRELIIGDRITGKTHFLLHTALTAASRGTIVVYVAIGKRQTEIKRIEKFLRDNAVYEKCVVVAASSYDSPGEIFVSPMVGMTVAEYFRDHGHDVVLVFDDLTTHAKYYREFALLSGNFPGRESYPGDVFHIHARLLERAGCFHYDGTDAAITCLPVVDSVGGDFTGYIQTNVMSMTDGHLFFDEALMAKGVRPALNVFLSVTRVGRQTQPDLLRSVGSAVMTALKEYEDAERFLRFGPELTDTVKRAIARGVALSKLFTQMTFTPYPMELLAVLVARIWSESWSGENAEEIVAKYRKDKQMRSTVLALVNECLSLDELSKKVKRIRFV